MSSTPAPRSKKPCSYFLKGTCAYGEKCSKVHVSSVPSKKNSAPPRAQNSSPKPHPSSSSSRKNQGSRRTQNASPAIASPRPQYPPATSILSGSTINRSPTPPDRDTIEPSKPSRPAPRALSQDICHFYPQGLCANGDECEFVHERPREPSPVAVTRSPTPSYPTPPRALSPNRVVPASATASVRKFRHSEDASNYSSSARSSSSMRSYEQPSYDAPASRYRAASPFGYQGVRTEQREIPHESDDEDRYADADEEEPSEIHNSIMKTPRVQIRPLSPQRRVYPVVASPKPVPYVTEIVPHWSQFADPKADGNVAFCKQLAQNQCVLGDECRFRHSLTIDEYTMLFKDQQPNLWTVSRVNKPQQVVSSPPTTTIVSPPPIARTTIKTAPKAPAECPAERPAVEKKPCNFWTLGKCKNGTKCPFAHIGTPPLENPPQKSTTICRNLQVDGECKYGAACFYSHDLPSTSGAEEQQHGDSGWAGTTNENGWGSPTNNSGWGEDNTAAAAAEQAGSGWGTAPAGDSSWGPSRDSHRSDGWTGSRSSSSLRTGSRVCYDYSKGQCVRGNACRFAHDSESSGGSRDYSQRDSGWSGMFSADARKRRGPCYNYQQGRCNRGDSCRFSHDVEPAEEESATNQSGWDRDQPAGSTVHDSWGEQETDGANGDGDNGWYENQGQPTQPEDAAEGEEQDQANGWEAEPEVEKLDEAWNEQTTEDTSGWGDASSTAEDGEAVRFKRPCKAFGQGVCARGDSCWYLHELPEDQVQYHREQGSESAVPATETQEHVEEAYAHDEEEPQQRESVAADDGPPGVEGYVTEADVEPEPTDLERLVYHCTVRYNNRCSPTAVMTAADSRTIVLSNLPSDSSIAEVQTLAARFGAVKEILFLGEATDSATVSIEFADLEEAKTAVKQLNDQPFGSRPISAKLDSRSPVFARSPLHSQMLMVSWPGPTLMAWAYYSTITIAKAAAAKLNETTFMGRKIGAVFDRPGKKGPYSIRLTGLPPGATKAELDSFCSDPAPNLTTLGEPSYTDSPEASIRKDLRKYGRIEDFTICPQNDDTFRTVAYVMMQTYSAASEAAKVLNKTSPKYLGEALLKVQHIYLASYKVLPEIFECIRDRIGVIRDKHKDTCKIIEDFDGYTHAVQLRASIDHSKEFAEANVELGELIDGSVILDEEQRPLWDPYLELPSSAKAIDKINDPSSDVPCFVHCDKRLQCARVYGSLDGQARGKKTLLKILKKVAEQCQEINLERKAHIAGLVTGGFATLQKTLGENKVSLSLVDAKLTVRGSAEDLEVAKGVVSDLAASPSPSSSDPVGTSLCPFCERVPTSPVKLTCRHAYCQACLQFALRLTATRDSSPRSPFFACIAPLRAGRSLHDAVGDGSDVVAQRCNAPLSHVVVRDNLSTAQGTLYLKAAFVAYVRTSQGRFFFCPTPDCSTVHRAGEEGIVVRCPECSSDACSKCSKRIHDGSLCIA